MSIEWTTSANRTVTCLYSAWISPSWTGEPQPWQKRAFSRGSVPHVRHVAMAVTRPSANSGPRFSQDRRLDTARGAVGFTVGDSGTRF
jgi:hypothetical protein